MTELISIGRAIQEHLREGKIALHPQLANQNVLPSLMSKGELTVHGYLNLSHQEFSTSVEAYCRFTLQNPWRKQNPALRCAEKWIRRPGEKLTADWHVNPDGDLCYILPNEWSDQIVDVEREHGTEVAFRTGAFIVVNNARWLLYRHLEGYRRKLIEWPNDWPQWPHGLRGVKAYQLENQRARS